MSKFWNVATPITTHVEVTERCNERCRHCYNFDRSGVFKPQEITWSNLRHTISELVDNKVMHIIITGGEPLLALDKTCYLAKQCLGAGMSVSLNSNLVGCTPVVAKRLREAGIDHCTTTLHSYKEDVTDWVANVPGTYQKVLTGIKNAQLAGIRVTVCTVLSKHNKQDIIPTGELCCKLGVKKFIAYRTIPSTTNNKSLDPAYLVGQEDALQMFGDLYALKEKYGVEVGSNRMVPECLFSNPEDYPEFTNRGCSAGKRHMLLNTNGNAHACVHEAESYGNIHDVGIKGVWATMKPWRTMEYIPDECQECGRLDTCGGGCRLVGLYSTGSMRGADNLCKGAYPPQAKPKQIDYREENGFYIFRTRGATVNFVNK